MARSAPERISNMLLSFQKFKTPNVQRNCQLASHKIQEFFKTLISTRAAHTAAGTHVSALSLTHASPRQLSPITVFSDQRRDATWTRLSQPHFSAAQHIQDTVHVHSDRRARRRTHICRIQDGRAKSDETSDEIPRHTTHIDQRRTVSVRRRNT